LLGLALSIVPPVLLLVWPFLDRTPERRPSRRKVSVAIGVSALVLSLLFGILGFVSESEMVIFGQHVQFDIYGMPHMLSGG